MEQTTFRVGDAVQVNLARTIRAFHMIEADVQLSPPDEPLEVEAFTAGSALWATAVVVRVLGDGRYQVQLGSLHAEGELDGAELRRSGAPR